MIPFHGCQYSGRGGHYESWFLRGNHPSEPRAFWIRYTLFIPADKKRAKLGELWAIYFDGTRGRVTAAKQEHPWQSCSFDKNTMDVRIGDAVLHQRHLAGSAEHTDHKIEWNLDYSEGEQTLLFLPEKFYGAGFPKAKSLVSRPQVTFQGSLAVDGERIDVTGWHGSENHNWGSQHTDQYAWGQVAGFDDDPEAFLECATARVKVGPVPTPRMTIAYLRLDGEDYRFNQIGTALKSAGGYRFFNWHFHTGRGNEKLDVEISAPASAFTALTYYNPPGGNKTCLNSKIASCQATLTRGNEKRVLYSKHGAAFEILTDRKDHGIPIAV
jgi:hypothetical protein